MKGFQLTPALQQLLRMVGDSPADALSTASLDCLTSLQASRTALVKLVRVGYLARVRRTDPPGPDQNPTRKSRMWYWRTPEGTAILEAAEAAGSESRYFETRLAAGERDERLEDDTRLMDPHNGARGAATFRDTMHDYGFTELGQLYALPLPDWRRFHNRWGARMKLACAEAGEPIMERHPADPHGRKDNRPQIPVLKPIRT